jgi:deoxyribodipyrimidine photo-lyase
MRVVHWFRNDLRLTDNVGLSAAAAQADELIPVFVLDDHLLRTAHASPTRQRFLLDCLTRLAANLAHRGSALVVRRGDPVAEIARLLAETRADLLTLNRDYTPYAKRRDTRVRARVETTGAKVADFKDRVVFESGEVRKRDGGAFVMYTPFRDAWIARYRADPPAPLRVPKLPRPIAGVGSNGLPSAPWSDGDGGVAAIPVGGERAAQSRLRAFLAGAVRHYARDRNRPDIDGTSRLSPYLRFGAISARQCIAAALELAGSERGTAAGARKWVDELIWREFYVGLLDQHPRLLHGAFRSEFDRVQWNDDEDGLRAWRAGRTGYPFVDAAMRQLVQTGWMHNRARMIVASFLTKDLLLDWRRGERVFMQHLVDGDPASNNGGWQWSASAGTDPQPYFRIFNPVLQGEKFDPQGAYVRRFVPELRDVPTRWIHRPWEAPAPPREYPPPIVEHSERRVLAVARYQAARATGRQP